MSGTRPRLAAAVAVLLLASAGAGVVAADPPTFEVRVPEPTLDPGTEGTLSLVVANDAGAAGGTVDRAANVEVTVRAGDTPFTVLSGTRSVGDLGDGESAPVNVRVAVPADVPAGTYRLPVRVRYEYEGRYERQTVEAVVRVDPRPRLRVVNATADLAVGERGTVTVTVENAGDETAREAALTLASGNADLGVGGGDAGSRYLGDVAPGERRTASFVVVAAAGAREQAYAMALTATFENARGVVVESDPMTVSVTPQERLVFAVRDVASDLRVGEEGTLRATVVNEGDRTARAAVVYLSTPSRTVRVAETAHPVGDLGPGESARVTYRATVPPGAAAGPRAFSLVVEYEDREGDVRRSDPVRLGRPVDPELGRFRVEPVAATTTVEADASTRLVVAVTNVGDEPLTDVSAALAAGPPFTTETPTAFVPRLAPGARADLAFELSVSEDAVPGTRAVRLNLTAERPDGGRVVTGPEPVAVTVVAEPADGGDTTALVAGAVVVLVVLGAGWYWLRG